MVVNFKACKINQDLHKLIQITMLIKKNYKELINLKMPVFIITLARR
jgi:hypothetical protein